MLNLVLLTYSNPQILEKIQMGCLSIFRFFVKSLINKNFPNARTSNDIDITFGTESKFNDDVRKMTMTSC